MLPGLWIRYTHLKLYSNISETNDPEGAVETFIIGAALSATSLGTTFSVISSAASAIDLSQTRVGSVLVSAAVIDDVVGLVLSRYGVVSFLAVRTVAHISPIASLAT